MTRIKIKICGITSVSDALTAAELGADAIGLNFYAGSSRNITLKRAEEIVRELPPFVEPVGLFVEEPMDRIRKTMSKLGLRTFQWYGELWQGKPADLAKEEIEREQEKLKKGTFNLNDFRKQFDAVTKMGGMKDLMSKMPGMGNLIPDGEDPDEAMLGVQRMIDAMTEEERMTPEIIDAERRRRIAETIGVEAHEVKDFLRQFEQMRTVMEQMANMSMWQKIKMITGMGNAGMFHKLPKPAPPLGILSSGGITPLRAIPAFPLRDEQSLKTITAHLAWWDSMGQLPAAILIDAHVPGSFGGTGKVVPWELLSDFSPDVPLILAGGLTPDNVAQAIRTVRPYGVDVASGVESAPGKKDADKMRRFIEQARSVND